MAFPVFRSASRVLVEARDVKLVDGILKVASYRVDTGGWFGWLKVKRLHPMDAAAREIAKRPGADVDRRRG